MTTKEISALRSKAVHQYNLDCRIARVHYETGIIELSYSCKRHRYIIDQVVGVEERLAKTCKYCGKVKEWL